MGPPPTASAPPACQGTVCPCPNFPIQGHPSGASGCSHRMTRGSARCAAGSDATPRQRHRRGRLCCSQPCPLPERHTRDVGSDRDCFRAAPKRRLPRGHERASGCLQQQPSCARLRGHPCPDSFIVSAAGRSCDNVAILKTTAAGAEAKPSPGHLGHHDSASVSAGVGNTGSVAGQPLPGGQPASDERPRRTSHQFRDGHVVSPRPVEGTERVHAAGLDGPQIHQQPAGLEPRKQRPVRDRIPSRGPSPISPGVRYQPVEAQEGSRFLHDSWR